MNILKMMMKSMENRHDRIVTKGVNPSIASTKEQKNERYLVQTKYRSVSDPI